jgi:hypothetical protein
MLNADDTDLVPSFTIKTEKQADGTFRAWTPNAKEVGSTVGRTAGEASHYLSDRLTQFTKDNRQVRSAKRSGT